MTDLLSALSPDLLQAVLQYVVEPDGRNLGACLLLNKTLSATVRAADELWRGACCAGFNLSGELSAPKDAAATTVTPCESSYTCFKAWEALRRSLQVPYGDLHASHWTRVNHCWDRLEAWYQANAPGIYQSLQPGIEPEAWSTYLQDAFGAEAEEAACRPSVRLLRYLWGRHNGQEDIRARPRTAAGEAAYRRSIFSGLWGGYQAYDHFTCVRMAPLRSSAQLTTDLRHTFMDELSGAVSISYDALKRAKHTVVDTVSGRVYMACPNTRTLIPCTPDCGQESILVWLEEWARQLEAGVYGVSRIIPDVEDTDGICRFAQKGPEVSRAVTRGIEVVSSAVYMPEHPQGWTYSIRVRLLGPNEDGYLPPEERGFVTAQLRARHWVIEDVSNGHVDDVRGNGVIGKYPLLREGGWRDDEDHMGHGMPREGPDRWGTFVYQSCSGRFTGERGGTFGGELIFVPGSLTRPEGPEFDVAVARFPLTRPAYIF